MTDIEQRWYWDRRTEKAVYPVGTDEDTVTLVSIWHAEEVDDARSAGALVPIEEVSEYREDTAMTVKQSFRTPTDPRPDGAER